MSYVVINLRVLNLKTDDEGNVVRGHYLENPFHVWCCTSVIRYIVLIRTILPFLHKHSLGYKWTDWISPGPIEIHGRFDTFCGIKTWLHFASFLFYNIWYTPERNDRWPYNSFFFFCHENMFTSFCHLFWNSFSLANFHRQVIRCQAYPQMTNIVSGHAQKKKLGQALLGTPIQAIVFRYYFFIIFPVHFFRLSKLY